MAETRETQVLEDVIESTEIENPRTTEEAILAQVIAGEEVTINARTRLQKYLSQLTSGGGESGYTGYEDVIGTFSNPWGNYTYQEILNRIKSANNEIRCAPYIAGYGVKLFFSFDTSELYASYAVGFDEYMEAKMAYWDSSGSFKYFYAYDTDNGFSDITSQVLNVATHLYLPTKE